MTNFAEYNLEQLAVFFLKRSFRSIFLTGLLGLLSSILYIQYAPITYVARLDILVEPVSEYSDAPRLSSAQFIPLLLYKYNQSHGRRPENPKDCGFDDEKAHNSKPTLIKLSHAKNVDSVIELTVVMSNKEDAITCGQSLFDTYASEYADFLTVHRDRLKVQLLDYQKRLSLLNSIDTTSNSSKNLMIAKEEAKYYISQIDRLHLALNDLGFLRLRLLNPIAVGKVSSVVNPVTLLILGFFLGSLLGFLGNLYFYLK